jgi:hypothetical protein
MSKRCELQKEFYKLQGNYKGTGTFNDNYVKWLEDRIIFFEQDNFKSIKVSDLEHETEKEYLIKISSGIIRLIQNKDNNVKLTKKQLNTAISEIENAMERWHHARDNDNETIEKINEIMVSIGKLEWFNKKTSK